MALFEGDYEDREGREEMDFFGLLSSGTPFVSFVVTLESSPERANRSTRSLQSEEALKAFLQIGCQKETKKAWQSGADDNRSRATLEPINPSIQTPPPPQL